MCWVLPWSLTEHRASLNRCKGKHSSGQNYVSSSQSLGAERERDREGQGLHEQPSFHQFTESSQTRKAFCPPLDE